MDYSLLADLHLAGKRQGPGGDAETRRAMELAGLDASRPLVVADIGCGTGASTLLVARELDARVTAVDRLAQFLEVLESRAQEVGVADRVTTMAGSMDALPLDDGRFDVVWSEGAIYNMGFEAGISNWKRFLKPGGVLVVSEITWLTAERPAELTAYWENAYAEIATASEKIAALERSGYTPVGYFALPEHCWLDNYYRPLEERFAEFLARHGNSPDARAVVEAEREEIAFYEKYHAYYSYGMYIARTS